MKILGVLIGAIIFLLPGILSADWIKQQTGVDHALRDSWFTSVDTGYVTGEEGTILYTRDGGQNWHDAAIDFADIDFFGLHFSDSQHGFMASGEDESSRELYLTKDYGENWEVMSDMEARVRNAVYFTSPVEGYYGAYTTFPPSVFNVGYIMYVRDSTTHHSWNDFSTFKWVDTDMYPSIRILMKFAAPTEHPQNVFALAHTTIELSGNKEDVSIIAVNTDFENKIWEEHVCCHAKMNDISFPLPDIGYIAGDSGKVFKMTLQGDTISNFLEMPFEAKFNLNSIHFFSQDSGIVAGDSGQVYETTDGGKNWQPIPLPEPENILSIASPAGNKTVYLTTDKGNVWKNDKMTSFFDKSDQISGPKQCFEIFPNPVNHKLTVNQTCPDEFPELTLSLINNNGQKVKEQVTASEKNMHTLSLEDVPPGFYYIIISNSAGIVYFKQTIIRKK